MRPTAAGVAFWSLGLIWGSNFLFMKWASETITPGQITFLRVLCGFLPILLFAAARNAMRWSHARHIHHFLVMSVLATSLYYFAFADGTSRLPSGIAGALSGAIPLFSFVAAAIFLRSEPIAGVKAVGVALGLVGVLLIARPWDTGAGSVDGRGVLAMVVGSLSVGLSFVYARRFLSPLAIAPEALTAYQIGLALITLTAVTDFDGITDIADDSRALWGMALGLGLAGTGVAYILYYFIVDKQGAVTASSATYIPPAGGPLHRVVLRQ